MRKSKHMVKTNKIIVIRSAGIISLVISPIAFWSVLLFFKDILCNPGPSGHGCGFANVGLSGYALYFALPFLTLGVILVIISIFKEK
jgi:hypothetical protein